MDETYRLLREIKRRPGMYLGRPSLELLYTFLNGYKHREAAYQPDCLEGFNEYIQERYGLCTDHNWASVIRFFSPSDEKAFEMFYQRLDDFLKTKE